MSITVVTPNWGQIYKMFLENQKKNVFLESTIGCELCVYGQGVEKPR